MVVFNCVVQIKLQKNTLDPYHFVHMQVQEYVLRNEIIRPKVTHILIVIALSKLFSILVVPIYILISKKWDCVYSYTLSNTSRQNSFIICYSSVDSLRYSNNHNFTSSPLLFYILFLSLYMLSVTLYTMGIFNHCNFKHTKDKILLLIFFFQQP